MLKRYIKLIRESRVYDVATVTPLVEAARLSRRFDNVIWMKREDLQPVHSFKLRGAYNKISALPPGELKRGVIAASAGNHAQGVALAARKLGVKALIVMPQTTPSIKIEAVRDYGATIKLVGDTYDDAYAWAAARSTEKGIPLIHPYDDPLTIAGQGTIGLEILEQHPADIHAIFIPVGGGGLLAGIAAAVKATCPAVKIIGVEPDEAPCMTEALKRGRRITLKQVELRIPGHLQQPEYRSLGADHAVSQGAVPARDQEGAGRLRAALRPCRRGPRVRQGTGHASRRRLPEDRAGTHRVGSAR